MYYLIFINLYISFSVESSAGLLMTTTFSRPSSACSKQNSDSISIESDSDLKRYLLYHTTMFLIINSVLKLFYYYLITYYIR